MSKAKSTGDSKKSHTTKEVVVEKDSQDIKAQFVTLVENTHSLISRYLLLFAVATSSLTVIIALLISQHYINPVRDEQVYTEGTSQTSFKEIDKEKLKTLEESLDNTNLEVETDFVPNRNNPFSE